MLRVRHAVSQMPVQMLSLEQLRGDVLLEDITSEIDQPPFPRSPLDGYAVKGKDTEGACLQRPVALRVAGTVFAGSGETPSMRHGECVRIMTGGRIPPDADAVIRQEDTDCGEEDVKIFRSIRPRQNYCEAGEDFRKGDLLVRKGTILDSTAVSVLAAAGVSEVPVPRQPRAGLLSTGDELLPPGMPLPEGKIYDSNLCGVRARLREFGLDPVSAHIGDDAGAALEKILAMFQYCDFVITTGGVSVGQKDILVQVLDRLSQGAAHRYEELFYGLKMKPGMPSKLVLIDGKPLLCLSGNPFAAAAVFELIGREILAAMTGKPLGMKEETGVLEGSFPKPSPVERLLRAKIRRGSMGRPAARIGLAHSSGQIRSMLGCNGFVDIPAGSGPVCEGETVVIWT